VVAGENNMPLLTEVFKINENGYSYEEAMDLDDVTPEEARREIKKHQMNWEDFIADVGEKPSYTGQEVLGWLGY
jgi:hypothetical protein